MFGRSPRAARLLGLWTAAWLFALLLAGLLWVGDLSVQWPVLLVPVVWALVALRPRRRRADPPDVVDEELQWYRGRGRADDPAELHELPELAEREPRTREQQQLPGVPPAPGRRREQ